MVKNQWVLILWITAAVFIPTLVCSRPAVAGQNPEQPRKLDPIIVTGSHIPRNLSETANSVEVITGEQIADLPAHGIADILEYVNGVDVRQRGVRGVQADVGIRGGSHEQTLIMVDGVPMNDSQTGHHNMDLPVNPADIERIEVIKGPAARIYGPNAMAGVINIITRTAQSDSLGGGAEFGEYGYYSLGADAALTRDDVASRLSAARRYSSGHISGKDTDFDIKTINYKGALKKAAHTYRFFMGYSDKNFGAYKFYSDAFPEQREKKETLLAYAEADLNIADMKIRPRIHWRRHEDEYRININGSWYRNDHRTDVFGARVNTLVSSGLGETSIGADCEFNYIESSNLEDHDRNRQSLFLEHGIEPFDRVSIGLGASVVHYSRWGWEYWPGANMSIDLTDGLTWFATFERSFRAPTYTELYYSTPANQGNPSLEPEKAWTGETGLKWQSTGITAGFSMFYRDQENAISWIRRPGQTAWQAANIATFRTLGAEAGFTFYPRSFFGSGSISSAGIAYTYLDADRGLPEELESKYVLDHLRHQLTGSLTMSWSPSLEQVIKAVYAERMAGDNYTVVDTRLTLSVSDYQIFIEAANLFDKTYVESGFAPMPGRWITAGVKYRWE